MSKRTEEEKKMLKKMYSDFMSETNKAPPMRKHDREIKLIQSGFTEKFDNGKLYCGAGCGRKITEKNLGVIVENSFKKGSWFVACTDPKCINNVSMFVK